MFERRCMAELNLHSAYSKSPWLEGRKRNSSWPRFSLIYTAWLQEMQPLSFALGEKHPPQLHPSPLQANPPHRSEISVLAFNLPMQLSIHNLLIHKQKLAAAFPWVSRQEIQGLCCAALHNMAMQTWKACLMRAKGKEEYWEVDVHSSCCASRC